MLSVIFVAATGVKAVIISENYSEQWDRRMSYLKQLKRSQITETDTIVLPPLPSAGWLHSGEIETYPGHFTNRHLQEYAGLKNPIILSKEKE